MPLREERPFSKGSILDGRDLSQLQRFALLALGRSEVFRWERDLMTPELMSELATLGLVVEADGGWVATAAGKELIARLSIHPLHR